MKSLIQQYCTHLADNALILSHRLGEWCGHGPVLEQDIAMTNIALDLLGQARLLYQYAAQLEGQGRTEDDIAYLRFERAYTNCLITEQPNGHFGDTIMRQFLFDQYHYLLLQFLSQSDDDHLAAIAQKSFKEVTYHLSFSKDWLYRLAGGTDLSHRRMQESLNQLYPYCGELVEEFEPESELMDAGVLSKPKNFRELYFKNIHEHLEMYGLVVPKETPMQTGGRKGLHTEQLGYILADLQYMQRAYPGMQW